MIRPLEIRFSGIELFEYLIVQVLQINHCIQTHADRESLVIDVESQIAGASVNFNHY